MHFDYIFTLFNANFPNPLQQVAVKKERKEKKRKIDHAMNEEDILGVPGPSDSTVSFFYWFHLICFNSVSDRPCNRSSTSTTTPPPKPKNGTRTAI